MPVTAVSIIYYHLPSDNDDGSFPNAFPIPKNQADIKLKDIKEKFPLPGTYHFRFKVSFNIGYEKSEKFDLIYYEIKLRGTTLIFEIIPSSSGTILVPFGWM